MFNLPVFPNTECTWLGCSKFHDIPEVLLACSLLLIYFFPPFSLLWTPCRIFPLHPLPSYFHAYCTISQRVLCLFGNFYRIYPLTYIMTGPIHPLPYGVRCAYRFDTKIKWVPLHIFPNPS